jgi:catechol-2,3-dioxygenase
MSNRDLLSEVRNTPSLSHVVLRTADLEACVAWYSKLLGARVVNRGPMTAVLTFDAEHHRIALMQVPPASSTPDRMAPGLEHIAFKIAGLGELLGRCEELAKAGVNPSVCLNHIGTSSIYYHDPDGVMVELFVDNLTVELSIETMDSEAFQRNPVGVPFDPAALLARYRAGEPLEELMRQPALDEQALAQIMAMGAGMAEAAKHIEAV